MEIIRPATPNDKETIQKLWKICFSDTDQFVNWFFDYRYVPEYTVCVEVDGQVVSAMQSYPLHTMIRKSLFSSAIVAGVSTHPDFRGKGYMKKMAAYYMNYMRRLGIDIVPYTPAHLTTFYCIGHYPMADAVFWDMEKAPRFPFSGEVLPIEPMHYIGSLLQAYTKSADNYSGMIHRSYADMEFKIRDYQGDSAKCAAIFAPSGEITAYCMYFHPSDIIYAEEVITSNPEEQALLTSWLLQQAEGKAFHCKLAPDTKIYPPVSLQVEQRPNTVMGIANVQKLLRELGGNLTDPGQWSIELTDSIVPDNTGIFDFKGNPSAKAPQLRMEAGRFGQWISGYKSLQELFDASEIEILDQKASAALDIAFPKEICRMIDEY